MGCNHEHLRTVGFNWFCVDCGEQLDPAALFGKQEHGKNPPADVQADKPAPKTTTRKKAAKKAE